MTQVEGKSANPVDSAKAPAHPAPAAAAHAPQSDHPTAPAAVASTGRRGGHRRGLLFGGAGIVILAPALYFGIPWVDRMLNTVSTDDAYVNGHVTFVAPRVPGQVVKVLVDDNNRVKQGDLLVQLDKEPYQVQYDLKNAIVTTARADLLNAQAEARAAVALARSKRFRLQHAIEDVNNQIAALSASVANLQTKKANLSKAMSDYERARGTVGSGATSRQEFDQRNAAYLIAQAEVAQALQGVYEIRVSLGLPAKPEKGDDLTQVPPELDQNFSSVRQALMEMLQSAAQLGIAPTSYEMTPDQVLEEFRKRDPQGNVDRIFEKLVTEAPAVQQAQAKLLQAERDLKQADLNLRYCNVYAEIDGVVTRRNVNPGNNVQAGQSLMAVRSLTEIWIDANFKETQLADLRIGHDVDIEVDMYGSRRTFKGRITGFTYGTGSTLALLPAQNATGNFVKVVQRLPVRIDLTQPNPEDAPLFVGLSVTPYVNIKEPPSGPDAGKFLQPNVPTRPMTSQPSGSSAPSSPLTSSASMPPGTATKPAESKP